VRVIGPSGVIELDTDVGVDVSLVVMSSSNSVCGHYFRRDLSVEH
jgi:hypothetical protein